MSAIIYQEPVSSFNISMGHQFEEGEVFENWKIEKNVSKNKGEDFIYLTIKYIYKIEPLKGKSDFNLVMTIPFKIEPVQEIVTNDLYNCILLTQVYVKEVVGVIFSGLDELPTIGIYKFEETKNELSKMVVDIKALE